MKDYKFDEDGWPTHESICMVQGPSPAYRPSVDGALRCKDFNYDYCSPNWLGDGTRVLTLRGMPDAHEYSYATVPRKPESFPEYSLPRPTGNPQRLTQHDYLQAANALGVDSAAIKAVAEQESGKHAFDRHCRPAILFEGHVFQRLTKYKFDLSNEDLSFRYPSIKKQTLNKEQIDAIAAYAKRNHLKVSNPVMGSKLTVNEVKYINSQHHHGDQYEKLLHAMALDYVSALMSCSWGKFQIKGYNFDTCGFDTVIEFVKYMFVSESNHLNAFVSFIKNNPNPSVWHSIKQRNWLQFATLYNGKDQNSNHYAQKIADHFNKYTQYPNKIPGDI